VKWKIDKESAVQHLMDLLAAEGPSGGEGPVAEIVKQKLLTAGCEPSWIRENVGRKRMPKTCSAGNLIVKIPGTLKGPRIMFSAHMDTVPLCQGAIPVRKGTRIVAKGKTGLGGDDRAAVALTMTMTEALLKTDLPRPPITLLFTVGEENGMYGAKAFEPTDGGHPVMGFNLDGSGSKNGIIGALGAVRWQIEIEGRSAHAGAHPESGISAAVIAARAITELTEKGWVGRIQKGNRMGTANIGTLSGGEANNQVMDQLTVTGECRSHRPHFLEEIIAVYRRTFEKAAHGLKNDQGECGSVDWMVQSDYRSFRLKKSAPVVKRFLKAAQKAGQRRELELISAGLDANILNEKGIPTVTFGGGNFHAHALNEYVSIPRYLEACKLAIAIATEV